MGERKVLNKYIPADFDPRLVPRGKKPKDELVSVRMMMPFTIQCSTCSSFMYRGKKFNSKKEPMRGPEGKYLGIQRYRLYLKCSGCSRPFTFLTDPKNTDYEMESGGTRNYEVWHDKKSTEQDIADEKETQEKLDPMRALENRVLDSQREMENLDNLDEIKAMNMRHSRLMSGGLQQLLSAREEGGVAAKLPPPTTTEELNEHGLTATEEEMVRSIKFGGHHDGRNDHDGGATIVRLEDDDDDDNDLLNRHTSKQREESSTSTIIKDDPMTKPSPMLIPIIKVKRKRKAAGRTSAPPATLKQKLEKPGLPLSREISAHKTSDPDSSIVGVLGGLLGDYGSSDSD